jgi:SpoVK/Ycf46/Vps4 family AAA+-type ATPase
MAKVVAQLWKMPLLRLDVASVLQAGAEDGLRQTIRIAESLSPAILWIDELEKGFAGQDDNAKQSMGTLLTWMQEKTEPVFVVATANEVRALPPELLRKGRFDEIFFVDLPDPHERLEILDIHLRKRKRNPVDFDLTVVVEDSERYSGAELEQVVVGAMFKAYADGREVDTEDLIDSVREIVPLAVTMDDQLKDLRDWARSRARRASSDRRRANFFVAWDED